MKKKCFLIITITIAIVPSLFLYFDLNKNKIDFFEVVINIEKKENNYVEVNDYKELFEALEDDQINIIDIKKDIDLGYNVVDISSKYIRLLKF